MWLAWPCRVSHRLIFDCWSGLFSSLTAVWRAPIVDLHAQLTHFDIVFALKNDPVLNWKNLVFSMSLLVLSGSEFGATME